MQTQAEIIDQSGKCRKIWEDKDLFGVERISCWCGEFRLRAAWMSETHWHASKTSFTERHSPVFRNLRKKK